MRKWCEKKLNVSKSCIYFEEKNTSLNLLRLKANAIVTLFHPFSALTHKYWVHFEISPIPSWHSEAHRSIRCVFGTIILLAWSMSESCSTAMQGSQTCLNITDGPHGAERYDPLLNSTYHVTNDFIHHGKGQWHWRSRQKEGTEVRKDKSIKGDTNQKRGNGNQRIKKKCCFSSF